MGIEMISRRFLEHGQPKRESLAEGLFYSAYAECGLAK